MRLHALRRTLPLGLTLFAFCLGLLGSSGFVYAADRTVVGELWSQDG